MKPYKFIVGTKHGRLRVIKYIGSERNLWLFKCKCGNERTIRAGSVARGITRSCGCLMRETARKQLTKNRRNYGRTGTRFGRIFGGLRSRCNYSRGKDYYRYGGRGIKCLWNSYLEFREDMFHSYTQHIETFGETNTVIDRINPNGNYSKENCRWVTQSESANNRRNNRIITAFNESKTIMQWSIDKRSQASYFTIRDRVDRGWKHELAIITSPWGKRQDIEY